MDKLIKELQETNLKTTKFSLEGEVFLAKCVKCYDADSIHIVIKFNNKLTRF